MPKLSTLQQPEVSLHKGVVAVNVHQSSRYGIARYGQSTST